MEPIFFGRSAHLFGIFHPNVAAVSRGAVVVAPPLLTENIRTHYACREVSMGLSRSGFDVLRFDFSACGDSHGNFAGLRVDDWVRDLEDAASELKDLTGLNQLSVFSVRFSAALAAASSKNIRWDSIVMWDPILDGPAWVEQIEYVRSLLKRGDLAEPYEYLGEPCGPEFAQSLSAFEKPGISARRVVAIITDGEPETESHWDCRKLDFDSNWRQPFTENLFSHQVIDETIKVFTE